MGNKPKKEARFGIKNPLTRFLVIFSSAFILFYVLLVLFQASYNQFWLDKANNYADNNLNTKRGVGIVGKAFINQKANKNFIMSIGIAQVKNMLPDSTFDLKAIEVNFNTFAYLPTVLLISLIIASPVNWKRKLFALLIGLLVLNLIIYLKIILVYYSCDGFRLAHHFGWRAWIWIIKLLYNALIAQTSIGTSMMTALILWIMTTIRIGDIEKVYKFIEKQMN